MRNKRSTLALNTAALLPGLVLTLCLSFSIAWAQPQQLLHKADSLADVLQYEDANATLATFIKEYPQRKYDLGEAYFKMARNHFHLGHLETATQCNQQSADLRMAIAPDALGLNEQLSACICLEEGQYDTALEHLKKARLYPFFDDPLIPAEIALLESEIQEQRQQYDLALKAVRSAAEIVEIVESEEAPLLSDIYLQQAHLLSTKKDWAAAAEACQASLQIEESPEAHLLLGQALLAIGQPSEEAKTALTKAQEQGTTAVQIEAGLGLAQWELENERPYGVLAQIDRVSPMINHQQVSRGKDSGINKTGQSQDYLIAKMESLRAQAYLMEASTDSYVQALDAAYAGLEAWQRSGTEDTLPEDQLLEAGLQALSHREIEVNEFNTLFLMLFHRDRGAQIFSSDRQEKAAHIFFLETRSAIFGKYGDADTAFIKQLDYKAIQQIRSKLDTEAPDALDYNAFQQIFGPFEALLANKKALTLGLPKTWPAQKILQLPTTPEPDSGIWPFRHRPKPLSKRFGIEEEIALID